MMTTSGCAAERLLHEDDLRRLSAGQRLLIRIMRLAEHIELHSAAAGDATHQVTLAAGMPFITHLSEQDGTISREITTRGFWELPESVLLLSVVRPGMTIVDAGANVGYYTALLARCLGANGSIHAFEPDPRNFEVLLANSLLAHRMISGAPELHAHRIAIAESVGTGRLHVYSGNLGFHSLTYADDNATNAIDVETASLDGLRGFDGIPATITRPVDLLKADVQGAELQLLRGGERTLALDRPVVCLEFEPYIGGVENCLAMLDLLESHGYRHFRVFHSERTVPSQMLCELSRTLNCADVRRLVQSELVGPYGTLFSFPA